MKKFIVTLLLIITLFGNNSLALSQETNFAETQSVTISGFANSSFLSQQNNYSLEVIFDLSAIPLNIELIDSKITYLQVGEIGGFVNISDKLSSELIDTKSLSTVGPKEILNSKSFINSWLSRESKINSLIFQAKDLSGNNSIQISNIVLELKYSILDKTPPQIIELIIENNEFGDPVIKWTADKPVIGFVKYGKTSNYTNISTTTTIYDINGEIILSNLNSGLNYHFQLTIQDKANNQTKSVNKQFQVISGSVLGESTNNIKSPDRLNFEIYTNTNSIDIELAWSKVEGDIDGYIIYRSNIDNDNFIELTKVNSTIRRYLDKNVKIDSSYKYYVRAYKGNIFSENSPIINVKTPSAVQPTIAYDNTTSNPSPFNQLNSYLVKIALVSIIVSVTYLAYKSIKRSFTDLQQKKVKGLHNILKDPKFYTDYEGSSTRDTNIG
jgi:hypothetical protein